MGFTKNDPRINRNGRPKKDKSLSDILRKLGENKNPGSKVARKIQLAEEMWNLALVEKDFTTMKYIYNRLDGMPCQSIEHEIPDPVTFIIERPDLEEMKVSDEDEDGKKKKKKKKKDDKNVKKKKKNPLYGKKLSDAHKKKLSIAAKKRWAEKK